MNKSLPKISIIVPVYNMEDLLSDCITSILNQTFKDFELILIDDGSKDNSLNLCKKFAERDSRVIVLHKENGGQGSARNLGLDSCRGDYICFVDSDDTIEENYLELLLYNAESNEADISCARIYYEKDKSDVVRENQVEIFDNLTAINNIVKNKKGLNQAPVAKLYRKETFEGVRFLELRGYEDTGTIFKAFVNAKKVVTQNYSIYFYYQRENSTMHRPFDEKDVDRIIAYREMEHCLMKYRQYEKASYVVTACKIGAIYYVVGELMRKKIGNKRKLLNLCQEEAKVTLKSKQKISVKNKILLKMVCIFPGLFGFIYKMGH